MFACDRILVFHERSATGGEVLEPRVALTDVGRPHGRRERNRVGQRRQAGTVVDDRESHADRALRGEESLAQVNREVDQLTDEMLDLIDLRARADSRAADLPYGDQRRLELVRALATRPRLLMLDEPAAGMNAAETQGLLRLIDEIRRRYGLAVIVVEHDMDLIMNLCDRIQVLAHGEIIFEGIPSAVQANPRVREDYLGHA